MVKSKSLGVVSTLGTVADAAIQVEWENHHTVDVIIGMGLTFAGGPIAWVAGAVYFEADETIQANTGKSITEHLFD